MNELTLAISDSSASATAERCRSLGLSCVSVQAEGQIAEVQCPTSAWVTQRIIDSSLFRNDLRHAFERWSEEPPEAVESLWPGCYLAPLRSGRRRRCTGASVVVLLTPQLLESEQLRHVCDEHHLDVTAVARRVQSELISEAEALRTGQLLRWAHDDRQIAHTNEGAVGSLSQELAEAYEELSLLYKLSAKMTVSLDTRDFLDEACRDIQTVVGLRWVAMHLLNDSALLKDLRGLMLIAGDVGAARSRMAGLCRALLARCGEAGDATIVDDVTDLGLEPLTEIAQRVLIVPLMHDARPIGVIVGADKVDQTQLSSVDSKLVTSTAQSIGVFLDNAILYDDLQDMFMGTLRSLVSAIDAKDTYTFGHSERVAWGAQELARAAGLDDHTCRRVYLSGLVHDVGKIGVPESVLCKPGRLTDEEFEMIKTHPRIGGRILQEVRQMQDLLPGVLYHHERFDGRGYPEGRRGTDIPLFGRLICLADAFDAMSSNRTYRQALPMQDVLDEIRRCAGTQFDPKLADLFVRIDFQRFERMLLGHRERTSPLTQEMHARHEVEA